MTNPSAACSPEGSGGVINLIAKPTAPRAGPQTTGSIRANVGDNGRWNLGGSGSWQKDKRALSLNITGRDVLNAFSTTSVFETPRLCERSDQDIRLRAFCIGLSWSLGSGPCRQPEQFDFSAAPTGG